MKASEIKETGRYVISGLNYNGHHGHNADWLSEINVSVYSGGIFHTDKYGWIYSRDLFGEVVLIKTPLMTDFAKPTSKDGESQ